MDDHNKDYFRGLIEEGLDITAMAKRSEWSRAKIYRKFDEWGWERKVIWVEPDPPPKASPAAAPPATASTSPPTTTPGDLLTPEIRAKVEALKKKRRKP